MKKVLQIVYIIFIIIQLTACNEKNLINNSSEQLKDANESLNEKHEDSINLGVNQEITTDYYSLFIPIEWSYEKLDTGTAYFMKDDKEVGGIFLQPFYSDLDDPLKSLLPNHSEITETKELTGFFTEVQQIKLITTPSAASDNIASENWMYIFFVIEDVIIYEMYFNTEYINESDILEIARSLKITKNK